MTKENGKNYYKEQDLKTELCYPGEPLKSHETDYFPKLPPTFHPNVQHDSYIEELQDRADELRMTPEIVPEPTIKPTESSSWLSLLKSKWKKKSH